MNRQTWGPTYDGYSQWQTIYCSLMLLLVVFFVMLIAYSAIDKERFQRIGHLTQTPVDTVGQNSDMNEAMQSLKQLTTDLGRSDSLSITKTDEGFKAMIPSPVLFNSGNASLNDSIYPILDSIITIAKENKLVVQIEGHTDNIPINTQIFPSNWELSTMRAVNILRYFNRIGGLSPDRLVAVGFAEYQPIASNETPEGRKLNRRIEIVFRSVK